jgi:hypothetical protein
MRDLRYFDKMSGGMEDTEYNSDHVHVLLLDEEKEK